MNAVLDDQGLVGEDPITTLPYVLKAEGDGLHAGLPGAKTSTPTFVAVDFTDSISLGAKEKLTTHTVAAYDPLSLTLRWEGGRGGGGGTGGGGSLSTPLVRGMPYVSGVYEGLTPVLSFSTSAIAKVNGKALPTTTSDNKLKLEMTDKSVWQARRGGERARGRGVMGKESSTDGGAGVGERWFRSRRGGRREEGSGAGAGREDRRN